MASAALRTIAAYQSVTNRPESLSLPPFMPENTRLRQVDTSALGQVDHCFSEIDPVHLLDEPEDVASRITAEAFIELKLGIDVEGGSFLPVEGAEAHKVAPGLLQLNMLRDHLDNIDGFSDTLEGFQGDL